VSDLKKRKATDPMVNYEMFEKDGEIMIDFLLSENAKDGSDLIERNVDRYKKFFDKNNNEGIMLFGVSERAYGNDIDTFLQTLKQRKLDLQNAVGAFDIPEVTIVN
jgi:hypothetical protein